MRRPGDEFGAIALEASSRESEQLLASGWRGATARSGRPGWLAGELASQRREKLQICNLMAGSFA